MTKIPTTLSGFLWHFSRKYLWGLIGLTFVAFFWGLNMSFTPFLMKIIIDRVSESSTGGQELIDAVKGPAIAYVVLALLFFLVFRLYDYLILKTFPSMKADIVDTMFSYLTNHSYRYFQRRFSGALSNKINDISKGTTIIVVHIIDQFIARGLAILIGIVTLYFVNPAFSAAMLIWLILFLIVSVTLSRRSHDYSSVYSEARSQMLGNIVDVVSNILTVKLFARKKYESLVLKNYLQDTIKKDQNLHWYLIKIKSFQGMTITVLIAIMLWLLIGFRAEKLITIGDFALVLTLTLTLVDETYYLAKEMVSFSEELGTCSQAISILTTPHDTVDAPNAPSIKITKGEIIFDRVNFRYRKGHDLFTDKSITIASGEKVGLVGFSGSGKSTFVNLILRFFDIESGKILIDGQNIEKVTQDSLRSQIAMIPQDPALFHRSLMDNIRYGRIDATDEEVYEASEQAHCDEFISHMKQGYDALVGERGVKLSGGQRQRIAIARAIVKNAPILILDEATSALDSVTENLIQDSLARLMKGRTSIVIAHRLSTLFNMDRILVFDQGQVIEDGTHAELITFGGHYAKLWNMQAGGFLKDK